MKNTKKKISLLSFDLDGTLLNKDLEITDNTKQAIYNVMAKGIKVTLSSGRVPPIMKLFADMLQINGPILTSNGGLIINNKNDEILFEKPLDQISLMELCNFCTEINIHFSLHGKDTLYYTKGNPRIHIVENYNRVAEKHGKRKANVVYIDYLQVSNLKTSIYKVVLNPLTPESSQKLKDFLDGNQNYEYTYSMSGVFDITANGIDKGASIKRIADYYHIPLSEVCAFGDYDNDISIFQAVGYSVAMANASDNLKKIAMFHTASNNEDGIAKAISHIWQYF